MNSNGERDLRASEQSTDSICYTHCVAQNHLAIMGTTGVPVVPNTSPYLGGDSNQISTAFFYTILRNLRKKLAIRNNNRK